MGHAMLGGGVIVRSIMCDVWGVRGLVSRVDSRSMTVDPPGGSNRCCRKCVDVVIGCV